MTAPAKDLPVEERRMPSLLRHAGTVLPVLVKSPQHPSGLLSAYLQKKHRLIPEEKRAISAIVFHTLRFFPAALYCGANAAHAIRWDIGLAVPPKHGWFSGKFLPVDAAHATIAAAVCIALDTFPSTIRPEDLHGDIQDGVVTYLTSYTTCPSPAAWIDAVTDIWSNLVKITQAALATKTVDETIHELLAVRSCVSPWVLRSWADNFPKGYESAMRLAESLLIPSPVGLRVNGGPVERSALYEILINMNLDVRFGNLSPTALILEERVRIKDMDDYGQGAFEVQDEGSQIIAYAAAPERGAAVLDACAGAGGKTLHLATLMQNSGSIIAADTEFHRLKQVIPRAQRVGYENINAVASRQIEEHPELYNERFDTVLVDAPCTSLGTARRFPLPKWRLEKRSMNKIVRIQQQLLDRYAETVCRGGTLVYATCSLLPQENSEVIEAFLSTHPEFSPAPLQPVFATNSVNINGLKEESHTLQLTPLEHGTDGFFMARMTRH